MDAGKSRRSSILKPQKLRNPLSDLDFTESAENELPVTTGRTSLRRVSFACSNFVKEFVADPEKNTIWDSTYEEALNKSDSSEITHNRPAQPAHDTTTVQPTSGVTKEQFYNQTAISTETVDMKVLQIQTIKNVDSQILCSDKEKMPFNQVNTGIEFFPFNRSFLRNKSSLGSHTMELALNSEIPPNRIARQTDNTATAQQTQLYNKTMSTETVDIKVSQIQTMKTIDSQILCSNKENMPFDQVSSGMKFAPSNISFPTNKTVLGNDNMELSLNSVLIKSSEERNGTVLTDDNGEMEFTQQLPLLNKSISSGKNNTIMDNSDMEFTKQIKFFDGKIIPGHSNDKATVDDDNMEFTTVCAVPVKTFVNSTVLEKDMEFTQELPIGFIRQDTNIVQQFDAVHLKKNKSVRESTVMDDDNKIHKQTPCINKDNTVPLNKTIEFCLTNTENSKVSDNETNFIEVDPALNDENARNTTNLTVIDNSNMELTQPIEHLDAVEIVVDNPAVLLKNHSTVFTEQTIFECGSNTTPESYEQSRDCCNQNPNIEVAQNKENSLQFNCTALNYGDSKMDIDISYVENQEIILGKLSNNKSLTKSTLESVNVNNNNLNSLTSDNHRDNLDLQLKLGSPWVETNKSLTIENKNVHKNNLDLHLPLPNPLVKKLTLIENKNVRGSNLDLQLTLGNPLVKTNKSLILIENKNVHMDNLDLERTLGTSLVETNKSLTLTENKNVNKLDLQHISGNSLVEANKSLKLIKNINVDGDNMDLQLTLGNPLVETKESLKTIQNKYVHRDNLNLQFTLDSQLVETNKSLTLIENESVLKNNLDLHLPLPNTLMETKKKLTLSENKNVHGSNLDLQLTLGNPLVETKESLTATENKNMQSKRFFNTDNFRKLLTKVEDEEPAELLMDCRNDNASNAKIPETEADKLIEEGVIEEDINRSDLKTPGLSSHVNLTQLSPGIDDTQHQINYSLNHKQPKSDFSKIITGDLNVSFLSSKFMLLSEFSTDAFPVSLDCTRNNEMHLEQVEIKNCEEFNESKPHSFSTSVVSNKSPTQVNDKEINKLKRNSSDNIETAVICKKRILNNCAQVNISCNINQDEKTETSTFKNETDQDEKMNISIFIDDTKQDEKMVISITESKTLNISQEDLTLSDSLVSVNESFAPISMAAKEVIINITQSINATSAMNMTNVTDQIIPYQPSDKIKNLWNMYMKLDPVGNKIEDANKKTAEYLAKMAKNSKILEELYDEELRELSCPFKKHNIEDIQGSIDTSTECSLIEPVRDATVLEERLTPLNIDSNLTTAIKREPTLKEKIEEKRKRCKRYWNILSIEDSQCEFDTLFKTIRLVVHLNNETGVVNKTDIFCSISDASEPTALFVHKIFKERLCQKTMQSAVGDHYDILTLLDYVYLNMQKMLEILNEFDRYAKQYCLKMDRNFRVTFKIISLPLRSTWSISVDLSDMEKITADSVTAYAKVGTVKEAEIQSLVNNCSRGIMFLKSFINNISGYVELLTKRKRLVQMKEIGAIESSGTINKD